MTIEYREGDLFKQTDLDALAHGCNMQGVMGAGIAKTFRQKYPDMYEQYRLRCKLNLPDRNSEMVFPWKTLSGLYIFNLFTQVEPGPNASIHLVDNAFREMFRQASCLGITSIGMPMIGCGIGGLRWDDVEVSLRDGLRLEHMSHRYDFKVVVVEYKS